MRSIWKIWVDATTEVKAQRVLNRFLRNLGAEALDQTIEPYPKIGGHVIRFEVDLASSAWNDGVVEVIEMGQRVGYGWILLGSIRQDPSGWSSKPNVAGVRSIEWHLMTANSASDLQEP